MKKSRRWFVYFMIFVMMSLALPQSAVADSDYSGPLISDFIPDKTATIPGETINFTIAVEDDSAIEYVYASLISPWNAQSQGCTLIYDPVAELYEGSITLPDNALNGDWRIYVEARDSFGNYGSYSEDGVINVDSIYTDFTGPLVKTIHLDKVTAYPEEIINITVDIEDDSPIDYIYASLISPWNAQSQGCTLTYDPVTGLYEGSIVLPDNALNGNWRIYVEARDSFGNYGSYNENDVLEVISAFEDFSGPQITHCQLDKTTATSGETINFTVVLEDDSPIDYTYASLISPWNAQSMGCTMIYDPVTESYEGSITLPDNALEGNWRIYIEARDIFGNYGSYNENDVLTVSTTDEEAPVITNIITSPSQLKPGEMISISATITDVSGVNRMAVVLTDPHNNAAPLIQMTHVEGDSFMAQYTVPHDAPLGTWKVGIQAYDGYNNFANVSHATEFSVIIEPVTSISIYPDSLTLDQGKIQKLKADIQPSNATIKTLLWRSSDPDIASVTADGDIIAHKAGSTRITAVSSDGTNISSNTCIITVRASSDGEQVLGESVEPNETIRLHTAKKTIYLKKGKSLTLPVQAYKGEKKITKLAWKSNKPKVASVNSKGKIKAKKNGTAKITAKVNGKKITITVKIVSKDKKLKKLSIKGVGKTMKIGDIKYLTVNTNPVKATSTLIKWKSSNKKIIAVDKSGRIIAKNTGKVKLTASVGKIKSTKTVIVKQ